MSLPAQIDRVEPPNWWIDMASPELQLLVHGEEIGAYEPVIDYPGVTIMRVHRADSPNYLFIDLHLAPVTMAGTVTIRFRRDGQPDLTYAYELRERNPAAVGQEGFSSADAIYLITPDRFANGDPSNDILAETRERAINRSEGFARHGGDIQGIIDHLDYLADMGFTAIWPSPLLENDMPAWSYHGYAITDYYRVDPRFGTLDDYLRLAEEARRRGMKLIFDGVVNHCGSEHWWMKDLPFDDWLNFQDQMQVTSHRRTTNQDRYAAEVDKALLNGGWFVPTMPDLNQRNPFMATYLIQNSLWWIETLGLGGLRQDTYPYPYKDFLADWSCRIMEEYPNFSLVGEEWSYNPLLVAYWQAGHVNHDGYISCLKSPMDFPMQEKLVQALTEDEGWATGLVKLYEGLANDFAYAEPQDLMIFGDNHDMDRLYTALDEDVDLLQMALCYLSTIRGIPQFYYGTEVLISNTGHPGDHGIIRTDFPGGWAGDSVNGFTTEGLSEDQAATQALLRRLLNWRKDNATIHHGRTLHYAPQDGTYVYFRYDAARTIMVALNKNESAKALDTERFREMVRPGTEWKNVLTEESLTLGDRITIPARSALVLEWER
ncbi:MAG: glycoside hydrolase family 13 protein [Lewinella sp.]|nr:glycoside hydrolase family 13 protein [Lewinella sp.]